MVFHQAVQKEIPAKSSTVKYDMNGYLMSKPLQPKGLCVIKSFHTRLTPDSQIAIVVSPDKGL